MDEGKKEVDGNNQHEWSRKLIIIQQINEIIVKIKQFSFHKPSC